MSLRYCLCAAGLSSLALAGVTSPSFPREFQRRQAAADYDPEDLSSIKNLAAIGDSYSAGIGAGDRLGGITDIGAWSCSRYNDSYPNQINNHPYLGDPANRQFQFESCSGALVNDIKNDQIPRISGGQDAILLSASGNDAALVDILNQCVFQFFSPTNILTFLATDTPVGDALKAFGVDLGKYSRTCDEQLDFSENLINDPSFSSNIASLIDATKAKLNAGGTLYYTGYAKFWDEAAADGDWCSDPAHTWSISLRSFSTPAQDATGIQDWQPTITLTAARRKRMNDLVDLVNGKISAAVANAGDQVVFINYDEYVGDVGGRFCAPGVQEPQQQRWNLGFYELDVNDPLGSSPFKRSGATLPTGTFEGDINLAAELSWTAGNSYKDGELEGPSPNGNYFDRRASFIPDGYGRIFHPSVLGHTMISELVVWNMQKRQDIRNGGDDFSDPDGNIGYDQCPLIQNQTPPTCDMNKVSEVPYNVFDDGQGNTIYGNFCNNLKGLDPSINYGETVDSRGNPKSSSKLRFKRTPPPNPDSFKDYSFDLSWVPNKRSNQCTQDCNSAFSYLIESECGHAGGQSNDMTNQATIDIGCGFYSWQVNAPAKAPEPTYATGTCCFHLNEWEEGCKDSGHNLFADVSLVDNNKNNIYTTPDSAKVDGLGIDINDPSGGGSFQGPLPYPVHMTGEHQNDYIQFSYNGLSWTTGSTSGSATCSTGGWDPRGKSSCDTSGGGSPFDNGSNNVPTNAKRQMDCCFPC